MKDVISSERYKYILNQKAKLNDATFKIAAFYQSIMVLIVASQFKVVQDFGSGSLRPGIALIASWGLFWMMIMLTLFTLLLLLGGISAWFDYRREEAAIELEFLGFVKNPPSWSGFLRWYETYIVLLVLVAAVVYLFVLIRVLLPLLS